MCIFSSFCMSNKYLYVIKLYNPLLQLMFLLCPGFNPGWVGNPSIFRASVTSILPLGKVFLLKKMLTNISCYFN